MEPDHVTILMATCNGAAFLRPQLHSLAWQSHRNWSLFVSDDGSTDATRDILANFQWDRPLRLTNGPATGRSAANFLSALAHPDLPAGPVAFADQDDVWLRGKLARALRRLGQATGPALYGAESMLWDARRQKLRRSRSKGARPGFGNALVQNLFAGHTMVLNAAAVDLARRALALLGPAGLREIAFHDWFLYQLVAGAGGQLVLDPLPMVLYRQHGGSELGGAGDARGAMRRLRMLASGRWCAAQQAQALALLRVEELLTPQGRQTLRAFLLAPPHGLGRARALAGAGIARASRGGTALLRTAAVLGRA